jgi:hypothetical protein
LDNSELKAQTGEYARTYHIGNDQAGGGFPRDFVLV